MTNINTTSKTICITGASKGIGRALVNEALNRGYQVIGISRTGVISESNPLYKDIQCDLMDIENTKEALLSRLDGVEVIDVLINNAGLLVKDTWRTGKADAVSKLVHLNAWVPARLSALLLPYLLKSKNAHIINVSSMAGVVGSEKYKDLFSYGLSKAAQHAVTEYMSADLIKEGIAVNTIAPGAVKTDMLRKAFPDSDTGASPEDMASFILHFATSGNKVLTGRIIPVAITNP